MPHMYFKLALKCFILLRCLSYSSASSADDSSSAGPIIDLGYARYQGVYNATSDVTHFFGVRYAQSPSGPLRWKLPQTPTPVSQLLQATDLPQSCPNALIGRSDTVPPFLAARTDSADSEDYLDRCPTPVSQLLQEADLPQLCPSTWIGRSDTVPPFLKARTDSVDPEDCLVLNIYTPGMLNPGGSLPILVYMHAGGYVFGRASLYPGDDIIQASGGKVIFIVLQYRLGLFGFLSSEAVRENGTLNAGLLDQRFAFEWIQKYAHVLGGDPSKVTIWGDSAGGGSVLLHMVANGGKGLFRNGISSSIYVPPLYPFNHGVHEAIYAQVAEETDCSSARDTLECLRTVDYTTLETINANMASAAFFGTTFFIPVLDGKLFTQIPSKSLKEGKLNGESVLSIHNSFEGFLFVNETTASQPGTDTTQFINAILPDLNATNVQEAVKLYRSQGSVSEQMFAIMGEVIFSCPSYSILSAFPGRAYKAEFALNPARHLDDVPYYFPNIKMTSILPFGAPPAPIYNNSAFRAAFSEALLDFTLFSDVNKKSSPANIVPHWPAWSDQTPSRMVFNKTEMDDPSVQVVEVPSDFLQRCAFWQQVADQTWQ